MESSTALQGESAGAGGQALEILATEQRETFLSSVQVVLASLNLYQSAIDGRLSPSLEKALRRVQRSCGLPTTGYLDQATWQAVITLAQ
ncbi:MAG: peptidoglycan-binding domain-containing protein [Prochlorothrix sp.]